MIRISVLERISRISHQNLKLIRLVSSYERSQENHGSYKSEFQERPFVLAGLGFVLGVGVYKYFRDNDRAEVVAAEPCSFGDRVAGLPTYNMEEISKHSSKDKGVWVVYKEGVYDITDFIDQHPGGNKIMMAAGGSVEPFWMLYAVHKQSHVFSLLEKYRIGNVSPEDSCEDLLKEVEDPYCREPRRHPALIPSSMKPFNAEPPPELLVDNFITPKELFYVRNHLPVPEVDLSTYELEICGPGSKTKIFKMSDLQKLPKHTVTASIQCAGNRRSEMTQVKPVKGLNWGHAAIGNATFTGVRLCDLLESLGIQEDDTKPAHVQFEGLDTDISGVPYAASIPLEKALDKKGDVLLAYEMNGEPLTRDHGFPLRAIVPGVVGARNVKWLCRVVVSEEESCSHWQQNDYKGFCPSTDWDTVDFKAAPAIQELPVNSAICSPAPGQSIPLDPDGTFIVKGYAWSGGGHRIIRVDLTTDQGRCWCTAQLIAQDEGCSLTHSWGWTLWEAKLRPPPDQQQVEIWVKATDSSYNTQPETFDNIWNLRGVLGNAYHKIKVNIQHESCP